MYSSYCEECVRRPSLDLRFMLDIVLGIERRDDIRISLQRFVARKRVLTGRSGVHRLRQLLRGFQRTRPLRRVPLRRRSVGGRTFSAPRLCSRARRSNRNEER